MIKPEYPYAPDVKDYFYSKKTSGEGSSSYPLLLVGYTVSRSHSSHPWTTVCETYLLGDKKYVLLYDLSDFHSCKQ